MLRDVAGARATIALPRRELVQVMAKGGAMPDATALGITLPEACLSAEAGDLVALWMQPRGWMLMAPWQGEGALAGRLAPLASWARLTDQSHGRVVMVLSGPAWRDLLARLCRLDLHPRVFSPGCVVTTPLGAVQVTLRATAEGAELFCLATLAEETMELLQLAGAEFGVRVVA